MALKPVQSTGPTRTERIQQALSHLSEEAPATVLATVIDELANHIHRSTRDEQDPIREALTGLRNHPNAVAALRARFEASASRDFRNRFLTLQILGHLKLTEALPFLDDLVWQPLPRKRPGRCVHSSARQLEERLRVKAVHGIAFLRLPASDEALFRIMQTHPSLSVRVAAIDSYSWNAGDSREAAERLQALLSPAYHPYIQRPRFHRGVNYADFDRRMYAWMKRWAPKGKLPTQPDPGSEA